MTGTLAGTLAATLAVTLAALLAAAAVLVSGSPRGVDRLRSVRLEPGGASSRGSGRRRAWAKPAGWALALPPVAGVVVLVLGRNPILSLACALGGAAAIRARRRAVQAARAGAVRGLVLEACRATAAELRAGRLPEAALIAAIELLSPPTDVDLRSVRCAAATGGDVAAELRLAARVPGAAGLGRLAVCWHVAATTGAGLAEAVDRVADGLAADEAIRREVAAALAGPRASARLLLILPLLGVLLGTALGADPAGWLLHTGTGQIALGAAAALAGLGIQWTDRMVRGAEVS
jgi:tight adherence protein B